MHCQLSTSPPRREEGTSKYARHAQCPGAGVAPMRKIQTHTGRGPATGIGKCKAVSIPRGDSRVQKAMPLRAICARSLTTAYLCLSRPQQWHG
jgi:hypothetical protein